jgi:hypothetical protein
MAYGSRHTVECPDNDNFEPPPSRICHEPIEARAFGFYPANFVCVLLNDFQAALGGKIPYIVQLVSGC